MQIFSAFKMIVLNSEDIIFFNFSISLHFERFSEITTFFTASAENCFYKYIAQSEFLERTTPTER